MVTGTVYYGGEAHFSKYSGPAYHPISISAPPMGQNNNTPWVAFWLHTPDLEKAAILCRNSSVENFTPIWFFMDWFSGQLMHKVGEVECQKKIADKSC